MCGTAIGSRRGCARDRAALRGHCSCGSGGCACSTGQAAEAGAVSEMDRKTGVSSYLLRDQQQGKGCIRVGKMRKGTTAATRARVGGLSTSTMPFVSDLCPVPSVLCPCCSTYLAHRSPSCRRSVSFSCCSRRAVTCALCEVVGKPAAWRVTRLAFGTPAFRATAALLRARG